MKAHNQRTREARADLVATYLPPLPRTTTHRAHGHVHARHQMLGRYRPYTAHEWRALAEFPVLVGACVALSDDSGRRGTRDELTAIGPAYIRVARAHPQNQLIQRLVSMSSAREIELQAHALVRQHTQDELQAETLVAANRLDALLAHKSPPREAREYKEFAVAIGEEVASVAKEGRLFRHRNPAVSPIERAAIFQIAMALGLASLGPEWDESRLSGRLPWPTRT
jgi:hypothetical protein